MREECPQCGNKMYKKTEDFEVSIKNYETKKNIVVKNVVSDSCSNKECDFGVFHHESDKKITEQVNRERRYFLNKEELDSVVNKIMKHLDLDSKHQVSHMLGFKETFFHNNYEGIIPQEELLLRFMARDKENAEFVKELNRINFAYNKDTENEKDKSIGETREEEMMNRMIYRFLSLSQKDFETMHKENRLTKPMCCKCCRQISYWNYNFHNFMCVDCVHKEK